MNLSKNIYNLRKKNGISQEKLAEQIGVSRQTISNWELGETSPNSEQLLLLANILNVSLDELLDNEITNLSEKVQKTEMLVKKQTKINKIFFICLYFLVLVILIILMIVFWGKRDFTKQYQTEFTCNLDGKINEVYLEEADGKYFLLNGEEKYLAGNSIAEVFSSLETIKDFYLSQGAVCK